MAIVSGIGVRVACAALRQLADRTDECWFGEAPSNQKACAETAVKNHCDIFHAEDEDYFSKVAYWTTPTKECGDDRGAVCKDYSEWVQAWTEIKG